MTLITERKGYIDARYVSRLASPKRGAYQRSYAEASDQLDARHEGEEMLELYKRYHIAVHTDKPEKVTMKGF